MATTSTNQLATDAFFHHVLSREPRVAVFDCDGTLWSNNSGLDFMHWEIEQRLLPEGVGRELLRRYELYEAGEVSEYDMCGEMVSVHDGLSVEQIVAACRKFAVECIEPNIFPEMFDLVQRLRSMGCELWAVSSTAAWVVREGLVPFGIPPKRVLGVELACSAGRATAELLAVPTDEHKAFAIAAAAIQPDAVFGNSIHDLAMLEVARTPYVINANPDLREIAQQRGWVLFEPRHAIKNT